MKTYIERESLSDLINTHLSQSCGAEHYVYSVVKSELKDIPDADVIEIKHGHWFLLNECANSGVYCSVCAKKVYKEQYANVKLKSKFCPNCGSIMDGEFVKL